jgi:catechol 2,3-dioxygenase-like lactoylglutathione lyase family enzyme
MILGAGHVGVSVADLDRSIQFYRDLLGMELVDRSAFGGEKYEAILGVKGSAGELASLQAGSARIELFDFERPFPKRGDPTRPVSDLGISHFCLNVTDIRSMYERLKDAGVTFHCPPLEFFGTAIATYGRDPDGNVFELLQMTYSSTGAQ